MVDKKGKAAPAAKIDTEDKKPTVPQEDLNELIDLMVGDVEVPKDDESWEGLIPKSKHGKSISLGSDHKIKLLNILGITPAEYDENFAIRKKFIRKLKDKYPSLSEENVLRFAYSSKPRVGKRVPSAAEIINLILDETDLEGRL